VGQVVKRAILTGFNPVTYMASVLLLEATSCELQNVPIAFHVDRTSTLINGSLCAVLFFDETNFSDAVVLAVYSGDASSVPTPPPGRVTFVQSYKQISGDTIASGTTNTYTLTANGSGIPAGALGVLFKAYFSSPTANAYMQLAPHAASDITAYVSMGNLPTANNTINATGFLPVDGSGSIDVKANTGTCTLTLYTYGYVI
jgi:hypothetical protein